VLTGLRIEDPFLGFNELKCQWVNEAAWNYRVRLPAVSKAEAGVKHVLAFDGLDTFATVKLDGQIILESVNMWIIHRVDVTELLTRKPDQQSLLEIHFKSAFVEARKIKDAHPEHKWVGFNGDMARLAVRKAQYHWGWDWGPVLSPCGPWRPVRLETYTARIEDLRIDYEVDACLKTVSGTITITTEEAIGDTVQLTAQLGGELVLEATATIEQTIDQAGVGRVEFHINDPSLWYPHGYGEQSLYTLTAVLVDRDNQPLHVLTRRTGFRKIELVQELDEAGKTFYFRVNGIDIFCGKLP
jgi:beta-mannosidase